MRRPLVLICAFALAAVSLPSPAPAQGSDPQPVDYVDPMIGTLFGGFSFPGAAAPFGMVQLSPDTEGEFSYTGYQYGDTSIRGFSHHHIQSMGVRTAGDLPFMPTTGPVESSDPRRWMSPFSHDTEHAEAGYYSVELARYDIRAELTAGTRVGMHRYTYPPTEHANVILDIAHNSHRWSPRAPDTVPASYDVKANDLVVGSAEGRQGYTTHFAARFDRPFQSFTDLPGAGAYASFDTTDDRDVLIKVGISFVSRENALLNLDTEKPDWDFEALRDKTRAEWNDALKTILVGGGSEGEKTSFYTALYHAQHHPNVYQDVNGEYMGHDGKFHLATDHVHHANFSLWDTYRGENQLLATIQPDRYRDMMLSLLQMYRQRGRFPQWALNNAYPDYMEGDPIQPTIVDGYCRGLLDDAHVEEMYAALRSQAWDDPIAAGYPDAGNGKRSVSEGSYPEYADRGYIAGLGAKASGNFEYSIADFALALMADSLGETADSDELLNRAGNYRNLINPATGFAHPRLEPGTAKSPMETDLDRDTWVDLYRPELGDDQAVMSYWKEGTGWQYTWHAPHDPRGLFDAIGEGRGGDPEVIRRLDTYFSTPVAEGPTVAEAQKTSTAFGVSYLGNQHAPSNEHVIHAPYLYDYVGEPWKTQKIMRGYQALYRPTPDGLPGNDDLGSMSAWFVWSALGFYPVQGGAPLYSVGSPLFSSAVIDPVGETPPVEMEAPGASPDAKYIRAASLGDAPLDRAWFTHAELFGAGGIEFQMDEQPNKEWAAGPAAAPPSTSTHELAAFGCPRRESSDPQTVATTLTYVGETRARGDVVSLAARLDDVEGNPLSELTVVFSIAGQEVSAITGPDGVARASVTVPDHGRSQTVAVRFAGNAAYSASDTSATITWGKPGR